MLNDLQFLKSTYGSLDSFDYQAEDNVLFFELPYGDAKLPICVHFKSNGVSDDTSFVVRGLFETYGRKYGSAGGLADKIANSYPKLFRHVKHGNSDFIETDPAALARDMDNFNGCPVMCSVNIFVVALNQIFGRDENTWKDGNQSRSSSSSGSGKSGSISRSSSSSSRPSSSSSRPSSSRSSSSSSGDREFYRKRRNKGIALLVWSCVLPIVLSIGLSIAGNFIKSTDGAYTAIMVVFVIGFLACVPMFIVGLVKTIKNGNRMRLAGK